MRLQLATRDDEDQTEQDAADDENVGDIADEEVAVGDEVRDMPLPE